MHSTEARGWPIISALLPETPRRSALRAFWLVLTAAAGAAALAAPVAIRWPLRLVLSSAVAASLWSVVGAAEPFAWRCYHAWNRRLAGPVARVTSRTVLWLCYFVVFAAVGRAGSRMALAPGRVSAWRPRSSLPPQAERDPFASPSREPAQGWTTSYLTWTSDTDNRWALALLPFLVVLRWLSLEEERDVSGQIYTLF